MLADITKVRPLPPEIPAARPVPSRRRHGRGARLLAAAAAVVVLGGGAAVVWQQPWQDGTSQAPSATDAVLSAPDARSTSLDFPGGASATVTHSDSMGKAVIVTETMPPPPEGKVYQLWLDQPGERHGLGRLMPVKADQKVMLTATPARRHRRRHHRRARGRLRRPDLRADRALRLRGQGA